MTTLCRLDIAGPVATITLNRPEQRNALSIELLDEAHVRLDELADHLIAQDNRPDAVRVVVLQGEGRSFCAGMDLRQVMGDPGAPIRLLGSLADLAMKIRALPAVVVAKVRGAAIGGGCGLTCTADLCITHSDCKMGFPEVDLGVCPAVVAPWLVRKIGPGRSWAILLSGGLMTGAQAHEAGIADVLVQTEQELDDATDELTSRLSTGGPAALAATKSLLNKLDDSMDKAIARQAAELSASVLATPDAQRRLAERFAQRG